MTFEEVIGFEAPDGHPVGEVPEEWTQGRTAYGGLMAAAAVRAMTSAVEPARKLRHFSAQFVAAAVEKLEMKITTLASGCEQLSG